jgi:golgi to ER traffic protein 4
MTAGWYPPGDPDLQHYVGELLYKGLPCYYPHPIPRFSPFSCDAAEGDFEEAELHLIAAGKRDSARLLATMMFEWSRGGADPGAYACRGTLP